MRTLYGKLGVDDDVGESSVLIPGMRPRGSNIRHSLLLCTAHVRAAEQNTRGVWFAIISFPSWLFVLYTSQRGDG